MHTKLVLFGCYLGLKCHVNGKLLPLTERGRAGTLKIIRLGNSRHSKIIRPKLRTVARRGGSTNSPSCSWNTLNVGIWDHVTGPGQVLSGLWWTTVFVISSLTVENKKITEKGLMSNDDVGTYLQCKTHINVKESFVTSKWSLKQGL